MLTNHYYATYFAKRYHMLCFRNIYVLMLSFTCIHWFEAMLLDAVWWFYFLEGLLQQEVVGICELWIWMFSHFCRHSVVGHNHNCTVQQFRHTRRHFMLFLQKSFLYAFGRTCFPTSTTYNHGIQSIHDFIQKEIEFMWNQEILFLSIVK